MTLAIRSYGGSGAPGAAALEDIILYVGGTVAALLELEKNWPEIRRRFKELGFDRALPNTCSADEAVQALKTDLGID